MGWSILGSLVREDHGGQLPAGELADVIGIRGIAAEDAVGAQLPKVAQLGDRLLPGRRDAVVALVLVAVLLLDHLRQLVRFEAGQGDVQIPVVQLHQEFLQLVLVPPAGDLVEGNVERLLPLGVQVHLDHVDYHDRSAANRLVLELG